MSKDRILLIEPDYLTKVNPFGLQKIATYHLDKGDSVEFVKGYPKPVGFLSGYPSQVYITSLFTYFGRTVIKTIKMCQNLYPNSEVKVGGIFATLMSEYVEERTGIKPHIGLLDKVDNCIPNMSLFPESEVQVFFTTRSCVRKCEFCAVKKLEPKFFVVDNWKNQILGSKKSKIIIQDNNIIATPWKHQNEVVDFLVNQNIEVDFNSGFDCRLFKEKHAKLYSEVNLLCVRFAFDSIENEDGYIQRAIELVRKYNTKVDIRSFVLFNFNDKPEDFYYRVKELNKLKVLAFPMRYSPFDSLDRKKYVGKYWQDLEFLKKLQDFLIARSKGTMVIRETKDSFSKHYGRNEKEFIDIISNYKRTDNIKIKQKGFIN